MPVGHWEAIAEILRLRKISVSKSQVRPSPPVSCLQERSHLKHLCVAHERIRRWYRQDSLVLLGKMIPQLYWEIGLKFSNINVLLLIQGSPPASWDGRNSYIMGSALFSHPHRRNSHVNVFSGNSLKKTGTTPMPPPCTNTRTRRDSIMWPWIKTAHPGRDTGLNDTRNSLTFYPGQ